MSAIVLDGKKLAQSIKDQLKQDVRTARGKLNRQPGLSVILVGDDNASKIYVKNKAAAALDVGILETTYTFDANADERDIVDLIDRLNNDGAVDGILLQLPLPKKFDQKKIIEKISPKKDVDCFHPYNFGRLIMGDDVIPPCTPSGIVRLLDEYKIEISKKSAVVIGRSNIVGKPVSHMLLQRDSTVTICHSKTKDLEKVVREADILISAIGRPRFIKGDWIKKGAVVIDVGINREDDGKVVGDVDFESAKAVASYISPVPGGVGPLTIAMLMNNTFEIYKSAFCV